MKRLLCIVGSMDAGGAETFLMKVYRALDKKKYQMDFCVAKKEKNFYEDEINEMGGKIFRITPKSRNVIKNFNDIKKIVKENKYKSVIRVSQHSLSSLELLAAKFGGAKKLIFRSSNSNSGGGKINILIHYLFRPLLNVIVTDKIAPSYEAGKFMFGGANFKIINNGLNLDEYAFSVSNREAYRKEFGVKDNSCTIIGHVGRFNFQKNHKFLIDIFSEYHSLNENSELWLFGKGELENEIKKYTKYKKIEDSVKFYGIRNDICKIYSAMDCYIFPSLFEGMPNTIIEAQTSGLPCLVSNKVTKACKIISSTNFLDIEDKAINWAQSIKENDIKERKNSFLLIKENKYDITDVQKEFIKVVF